MQPPPKSSDDRDSLAGTRLVEVMHQRPVVAGARPNSPRAWEGHPQGHATYCSSSTRGAPDNNMTSAFRDAASFPSCMGGCHRLCGLQGPPSELLARQRSRAITAARCTFLAAALHQGIKKAAEADCGLGFTRWAIFDWPSVAVQASPSRRCCVPRGAKTDDGCWLRRA